MSGIEGKNSKRRLWVRCTFDVRTDYEGPFPRTSAGMNEAYLTSVASVEYNGASEASIEEHESTWNPPRKGA